MAIDLKALDVTVANLSRRLLECRTSAGYWKGELSSSALSTATAVSALALSDLDGIRYGGLIRSGLDWLIRSQNRDGGWGDTVLSLSNISTTALALAAMELADDGTERCARAIRSTERWLTYETGSLEPGPLAAAVVRRYGNDRTFSAPILAVLALGGRLGRKGWRYVPQLPFELAALPQGWFRWLQLPVVSYALPALVAIGQLRHQRRPSLNPVSLALRRLTRERTLRVLEEMQPASGGYLEAVPLTSFVGISLAGAGLTEHPVLRRGLKFLVQSARPDGSWPIDTNLATWVTTLAVNALAETPASCEALTPAGRGALAQWLLKQQYRLEHPYTGAAPGGWGWTDLPGAVPDADDTAGALLALRNLGARASVVRRAVEGGIGWLVDVQNRDGGIPTFCRGWGKLPFDRSGPDLTAHALLAWAAWHDDLTKGLRTRVERATRRSIRYLRELQRPDGEWAPLWFGNEHAEGEYNLTYGTARVLAALRGIAPRDFREVPPMMARARRWLVATQNRDGGWGGGPVTPSSIEETGLALGALADGSAEAAPALERGVRWLMEGTEWGIVTPPTPIGFYFARLWYFETLYPLVFALWGAARARSALARS